MRNKRLLVLASMLLVLALLAGIGCAQQGASPTPSPSASAPPTSQSPTSTSPKPSTSPTTPASPTALASPSQPAVIKWRGQNTLPKVPAIDRFPGWQAGGGGACYFYAEWLKQRTNGRLILEINPPDSIIPSDKLVDGVGKGTLDFAGVAPGLYNAGFMPEGVIEFGLPLAWETKEEAWDALYFWGLDAIFKKSYAQRNIFSITIPMGDQYSVCSNFPMDTIEQIKGKKIRSVGIYGKLLGALGAAPTTIPLADTYMALKMGTVDGAIVGSSLLDDYKIKEVSKFWLLEPNLNGGGCDSFYFNMNSLNALPDDIKQLIMQDTAAQMEGWIMGYYLQEKWMIAKAEREGYLKTVKWSPADLVTARKAAMVLWDEVATQSPLCKELVDIIKKQQVDLGKV